MKYSFYSYHFGCRVNQAEKELIDQQMIEAGFIYSQVNPDIYIINTCAVTEKAEREARQLIYQLRKKIPNAYIVITGCSATYWRKNNLYSKIPVDLVIENTDKNYLVKIVLKRFFLTKTTNFFSDCQNKIEKTADNLSLNQKNLINNKYINSGRYLIKIQDGCQRFCSFCIVPYLRGRPQSEKIKDLELKIKNLGKNIKEIILTAINTEAYGIDTGESLVDLLKTVLDKTDIPRVSLGSINPWSIDNDFLKFYQQYVGKKRLVDFFHIPVQSGSDNILRLMKRNYNQKELQDKFQAIRLINNLAFIATDVIVGFLGESDKDFEETYNFLKDSPIVKFHVFRFSLRSNTAAWYMKKRIFEPNHETKSKRSKALIELGKIKYQRFLEKHLKQTFSGLILAKQVNGYYEALLSNQIPVLVKGQKKDVAQIFNIKVIEQKKDKLLGKIV